ncbi:hypothetical protein QYE76_062057 [Lolium multiflorum]|uniref:Uncharacterized protein n=1 Tax=Lolium multiflorum TaxID=4521 RepID=A0AAD8W5A4_LOLMU|nr:hypothetical protein QYE76_062056 [Lolium multiflorum]KAK1644252.1 hypothetical protein QYE76_062057 [Lolium multiflorum]
MLWLLYAIPSKHRDMFTMVVNCVAIAAQTLYVVVYLKYAVDENYIYSMRVTLAGGTIAIGVVFFVVTVVFLSHAWSLKIVGITASMFGTAMFAVGIIDVVRLVKNKRSPFSLLQLFANLAAACIWTSFSFMFDPINDYVVVPNMTGVTVTIIQIVFHAVLKWKQRNNNGLGNNQLAAA